MRKKFLKGSIRVVFTKKEGEVVAEMTDLKKDQVVANVSGSTRKKTVAALKDVVPKGVIPESISFKKDVVFFHPQKSL